MAEPKKAALVAIIVASADGSFYVTFRGRKGLIPLNFGTDDPARAEKYAAAYADKIEHVSQS